MNHALLPRVHAIATQVCAELKGTPFERRGAAIVDRLEGPLRVAIAGRVKAGKSTLLNALVGERLAPTDAGECTRLVSWYRHGAGYQVSARLRDGSKRDLSFRRGAGSLDVALGDVDERNIDRLEIGWPASSLQQITLIDTPGLASINDENSRRTRDFLEADDRAPTEADAVIYLMRHLHRSDVEFLDAYMDRSVTAASPVNAVAVLSRADEIGAGRLDALESAGRIASRYREDPKVRGLAATVVPLAGLLAETGLTLREEEAAALRVLADTPTEELDRMLMSAEQFCDIHSSRLTAEIRRDLLGRLGMFGVRVAIREIGTGAATAAQLGPRLVDISGLGVLRGVIADHFTPRANVLKARTALATLRSLARDLHSSLPDLARRIDRTAEEFEAGAVEFTKLRAAHIVASGSVRLDQRDQCDLQRLLLSSDPAAALGLDSGTAPDGIRAAALAAVARWRTKSDDPLADPRTVEVAEAATRTCEAMYATAAGST